MDVGKGYKLTGMQVREFRGEKYPTISKTEYEITVTDDIGKVKSYRTQEIFGGGKFRQTKQVKAIGEENFGE